MVYDNTVGSTSGVRAIEDWKPRQGDERTSWGDLRNLRVSSKDDYTHRTVVLLEEGALEKEPCC